MGLGALHTVGLDEARERARLARLQLLDGIDPINAGRASTRQRGWPVPRRSASPQRRRRSTIRTACHWRNAKHRLQFINTLKVFAFPIIGKLPVNEITEQHVLRVLEQKVPAQRGFPAGVFWNVRRETASRVRQRIELVLNWCVVRGYRTGDNPARWQGFLQHALPKNGQAQVEHHPALPFGDLPAFMADLRQRDGIAAQALQFCHPDRSTNRRDHRRDVGRVRSRQRDMDGPGRPHEGATRAQGAVEPGARRSAAQPLHRARKQFSFHRLAEGCRSVQRGDVGGAGPHGPRQCHGAWLPLDVSRLGR